MLQTGSEDLKSAGTPQSNACIRSNYDGICWYTEEPECVVCIVATINRTRAQSQVSPALWHIFQTTTRLARATLPARPRAELNVSLNIE